MKKSRFSEEQIIALIKEQEGGVPTAEVCRSRGFSQRLEESWVSGHSAHRNAKLRRPNTTHQEKTMATTSCEKHDRREHQDD